MCDITVKIKDKTLNVRVAVVPYCDDKVLIVNKNKHGYYSLVGGRVQIGECSLEAGMREAGEELGIEFDKDKMELAFTVENFFDFKGEPYQEYLFIYKYKLKVNDFKSIPIQDKVGVEAIWVEQDKLKDLQMKPSFMKNFEVDVPLKHIIIK